VTRAAGLACGGSKDPPYVPRDRPYVSRVVGT